MNMIEEYVKRLNRFRKVQYNINSDFAILETMDSIPEEHKDWAIRHGGFDKVQYKGSGQRIAVLDTGVDIKHQDLRDKVNQYEFVPQAGGKYHPHGTFCVGEVVAKQDGAGVVGVAPHATCFSGRVLYADDRDQMINCDQTLSDAIRASVSEGCGVISMSLGGIMPGRKIKEALAYAVDNGVIPFAAAGNSGLSGSPFLSYPAGFTDCISVTATNEHDLPSWFSSEGTGMDPEVDPEIAISSIEYYWGCITGNRYGKMIGTSMACPMAAGVCLLWRQKMESIGQMPKNRNALREFRKWIKQVANDTNENGWDRAIGWGVLLLEEGEL